MPKKAKGILHNQRVAIVVLNYNNPIATVRCLNSIKSLSHGKTEYEIVVIDNGSSDDTVRQIHLNYPSLRLIEAEQNLGYAGGNNLGMKIALKENFSHVLILNNDTQVIDDLMLDKLLKGNTDLAAPSIKFQHHNQTFIDFGGQVDYLLGRNTHLEFSVDSVPKVVVQPDYLSGTCLLVNCQVFRKIGLLDDHYFLYYEDVDFCLRAVKAGFKLSLSQKTTIFHELSSSANKLGKNKIKILSDSHRRFVLHHLSPLSWLPALAFNLYLSRQASK